MKQTSTESLHSEESNDMQKCIALYKMAACSWTQTAADILGLLNQQKELEDALTTDLDADEDVPESNRDGTQALAHWELLTSSGISLGWTSTA